MIQNTQHDTRLESSSITSILPTDEMLRFNTLLDSTFDSNKVGKPLVANRRFFLNCFKPV